MPLSRRRLLTGSAGVAAGGLLAACGSPPSAPRSLPSSSPSSALPAPAPPITSQPGSSAGGAPSSGSFPAEVAHRFGTTTVRSAPARVVALGRGDADVLLALGVVPVGVREAVGPWARDRLAGATPRLLDGREIDVDAVAALRPDLITAARSDNARTTWQRLQKIAPTVAGPRDTEPYGIALRDQTVALAQAIGRQADGTALVAGHDRAVAAARAANPAFAGRTVCVAGTARGRYSAHTRGDGRVGLLEALGFTNSRTIEDLKPPTSAVPISREQVLLLDADLTVVFGASAELRQDTLLMSIPSAVAGRLLVVEDADLVNAFATNSVLSTPWAIQRFIPMARAALARR
jgi:iron complex transport system substrate-binding protein